MAHKKKTNPYFFLFSLLFSGLLLGLAITFYPRLPREFWINRLVIPLCRMLFLVFLGLIIGETIEATGWTRHLAVLARPIFKYSNLGNRCSAAFTTAFFSGVTANTLLMDFYKQGKISKKQLFLTNFINQFPAFFLHLPSTLFIILPLTGRAGMLYLGMVFAALILRTLALICYGHFCLTPMEQEQEMTREHRPKTVQKALLSQILNKVPGRMLSITQFVIPIYLLVFCLNLIHFFDFVQNTLAKWAVLRTIPLESLSMIVISFLADYTSGFATAGALLHQQVLTCNQGALALVIGNIIAFPLRAIRHQLPRYLGIYSPGLGSKILLCGQLIRITSLILIALVFALVWT